MNTFVVPDDRIVDCWWPKDGGLEFERHGQAVAIGFDGRTWAAGADIHRRCYVVPGTIHEPGTHDRRFEDGRRRLRVRLDLEPGVYTIAATLDDGDEPQSDKAVDHANPQKWAAAPVQVEDRLRRTLAELLWLDDQLSHTPEDRGPRWERRNMLVWRAYADTRAIAWTRAMFNASHHSPYDSFGLQWEGMPEFPVVVIINLPDGHGQASWHVPAPQTPIRGVNGRTLTGPGDGWGVQWDGHTRADKAQRIAAFLAPAALRPVSILHDHDDGVGDDPDDTPPATPGAAMPA